MRLCLVKQPSFLLNEFQIAPIYCILMRFPSIFVMEQSLALSSRMEFPPYNFHLPSGSLL